MKDGGGEIGREEGGGGGRREEGGGERWKGHEGGEKGGRRMEMRGSKESTLISRFKVVVYFYVGTGCSLLIGHGLTNQKRQCRKYNPQC